MIKVAIRTIPPRTPKWHDGMKMELTRLVRRHGEPLWNGAMEWSWMAHFARRKQKQVVLYYNVAWNIASLPYHRSVHRESKSDVGDIIIGNHVKYKSGICDFHCCSFGTVASLEAFTAFLAFPGTCALHGLCPRAEVIEWRFSILQFNYCKEKNVYLLGLGLTMSERYLAQN